MNKKMLYWGEQSKAELWDGDHVIVVPRTRTRTQQTSPGKHGIPHCKTAIALLTYTIKLSLYQLGSMKYYILFTWNTLFSLVEKYWGRFSYIENKLRDTEMKLETE